MKIRKLIQVTANHIRRGKRNESDSCAIALAIGDAGFPNPQVLSRTASFDDGMMAVTARLSKRAQNFVQDFDKSKKSVKPFRFFLVWSE